MSTKDTGGPAFPSAHQTNWSNPGMTPSNIINWSEEVIAASAYRQAEAMVKEKKARQS